MDITKLRNIGIIAHIDAGKTTTTERILFYSGKIHKLGEVDEGTAVMDWMPEEQEHGITITAATTTCFWREHRINIIDTPGHIDFTIEVGRSLRVLDSAIVIFSLIEGVEPQSEAVWYQADNYKVPRIIYINKLDKEGTSFLSTVENISKRLKITPLPIQLPIGEGKNFMGVIDLITLHGYIWHEETIGKEYSIIPTPEDMVEDAYLQREQLIETLIQKDELLFERYLSKKELTPDEIKAAIRRQTIKCRLFPTLCGSSLKNRGIQPLIDAVVDYLPAPSDLPPIKGWHPENNKEDTRICSPEEPVAALCFKIRSDPYLGNLAYIRLYSGKIRVGEQLYNPRIKRAIRVEKLLLLHANKRSEIKEAQAGEIAAIAGKKDILTGDTLCSIKEPIILEPIHPPEPVICVAIEPEKHEDVDKFLPTLKLLTTEDPTLKVNFNPETGQVLLFGMGELHLEITLERLRREFNLNLRHFPPQVAYKESIKKEVIREGRYIKQTGGKGHYGHVILKISPLAKIEGKEVIFENKITGGKIPKEYIPGVEKGIKEAAQAGILGGFSVIDIKVSLIDGSFHEVDSSELAFKNAAYQAFKEALSSADPILVEPIMKLEINIPEEFLGNVCDDINSKRGEIKEIQAQDNRRIIKVEAPLRCLFGYATTLRSLTQGRGNYFMDFSHYQELPQKLLPQVLGERVNV